ncbi:hypothetical protein IGS74_06255 [Aureimonas sp. OT7]|uniref:Uncharacterized protein n=1 Tax=Aureimonas altamirensis TaxID=370622 RepID=A0A0B1Q9Z5_9HYPH|nr:MULTISPECIES: hypothetical protein [Aureimonas]KHJ55625.1 hypothetical protein LA66_02955 [Aureimonas altamirensis]QOG07804.1 hypothetical protein IGS74_06255 [Aureimonas sp. OT7]
MRQLTAAALATIILGSAGAAHAQAPATQQDLEPSMQTGTPMGGSAPVDSVLGTGALPGVGMGSSAAPDTSGISGPGGLQNGVGAQGVAAPSLSGSAVTNDGSVPGTGQSGFGIPLDPQPATGN